ncbi:hypothetical protein D3C84_894040 [compost metagenome]
MRPQLGLEACWVVQLDQPSAAGGLHRVPAIGDDQDVSGLRQGAEQRGAQRCGMWALAQWKQTGTFGWHVEGP